ncbi:MAG TPA: cupin domain-containing protein [Candidatus Omnitrophota bacterium]|nr:cupin domain-containing protein [Candidatus Omnitrophota bacterium]HPT06615.1 cupin domain-containing protein [Candidatus Omnitrophota bacterium]
MRKPFVAPLKEGQRYQRLVQGVSDSCGIKSGFVTLQPAESIGEHVTESKEEVIVLLSGSAKVSYGEGQSIDAEAPSAVYMPPETKHNVTNAGTSELRYVFITSPVNK